MKQWKNLVVGSLFIIFLLLTLWTRYYALDYAPPGSDPDSAWISIDAADLTDRGVIPHYVDPLHSPDPIIVYLIGLSKIILGVTIYTSRAVTATASLITVLLMIPMMWELLPEQKPRTRMLAGIFAMGAAASSLHAMNISRLGHDSPVLPMVVALTIWMTAAAWYRGGWWRWVVAGIFLASTQYVYLTGRMMGLVPPAWVVYTLLANRHRFRSQFRGWFVMGSVALLLVLPNLIMFVTLPESFSGRVESDNAGTTGLIWETNLAQNGELPSFLMEKAWRMFRAVGINWTDKLLPMSTPVLTPLFFAGWIIGILVSLWRIKHVGYGLLLIAMPLLLLGDLITSVELNPTPMRQTQVLPVYYAFAGIGLAFLWEKIMRHANPAIQFSTGSIALVIALAPTIQGFNFYINSFVPEIYARPETAWRISQTDIDISQRLVSHPEQSYLLPYGEYTRKTVAWLTLAGFPERHSAITSNNTINIANLPDEVLIIQSTDPERARLDTAVGLNYIGWWVLLHDGQTILLPPLEAEQQDIVSASIAETPVETIIDASNQTVATLHPLNLPDNFFTVPDYVPVDAVIGRSPEQAEVRLVGYTVYPSDPRSGEPIYVSLYWQPLQGLTENYEIFVQLWDDSANVYGESHELPYEGTYRTRIWYPDEITVTHHIIFVNSDLPAQRYTLATNFYRILQNERLTVSGADANQNQDIILLDDFRVEPPQEVLAIDAIEQTIRFGDYITIDHFEILGDGEPLEVFGDWAINLGETLDLRMQLDVLNRPPVDYSYFVHLIPENGEQPLSQADQALGISTLPSGTWRGGDTWFENLQIQVPDTLEAGVYNLWIGIYYYADGSRLAISLDDALMPDNRLNLGRLIIE